MIVNILLFALGLVALIKGGDWFVDGATGIAHRFRLPEILIGATIVSIGTTLPEVMVSATSAIEGHGEIAYGNAIGSIICNTALIAALTMAIRPSEVDRKSFRTPVIFFFGAAILYSCIAVFMGTFERWTGILLLVVFFVYMVFTIRQSFKNQGQIPAESEETEGDTADKPSPLWKEILFLVIGAALIAVGARLLVDNGTVIAEKMGVPESVIALTFVALGTSLPELVTAITSLAKGHSSLSLGNIVGANLFNLVLVSGASITLNPFALPAGKMIGNANAALVLDTPLMLFVMMFMTIPTLLTGKIKRYQGIVLLCVYAAYCIFQFAF